MHRTLLLSVILATTTFAQTPQGLIGLTRTTPRLARADMSTCASQSCAGSLGPALLPYAGGTAHDGMTGLTWVSNGTSMAGFGPSTCNLACTPFAAPVPAGTVLTGLAAYEPTRTLFIADSGNGILRLTLGSCTPALQFARCVVTGLQPNHVIGGLAVSDTQDLLFLAGSTWTGAPNSRVYVATRTNPCTVSCSLPVPNCGTLTLGPITGLAFDDCRSVLWLTDGRQVLGLLWNRVTCTATQVVQCCAPAALGEPFVGLCVEPSHATSLGTSCTSATCAACPQLQQTTRGDPIVNNNFFALRLDGAPAQQRGWLTINTGACVPGVSLPPFCGPLRVPLGGFFLALGPIVLGGTTGCTGSAIAVLSIPNNVTLCGLTMSSQFLVLCQSATGAGTGVSNCLSWTITGS
jgi:hypothetical protein